MDTPSLALLRATADGSWISIEANRSGLPQLLAVATVRLPDGTPSSYRLVIAHAAWFYPILNVMEQPEHRRLPDWCPERHINPGGVFCLGWGPTLPLAPLTLGEAQRWWAHLAGYLDGQEVVAGVRRWPRGQGWNHGDPALQAELERLDASLPAPIRQGIVAGTVKVQTDHEEHLQGRREPCACGSGQAWRVCHEREVVRRLALPRLIAEADRQFWAGCAAAGRTCCGTVDGCPLSKPLPRVSKKNRRSSVPSRRL